MEVKMNEALRRYYRQIDWSKVETQPYRLIFEGLGVEELLYCIENYEDDYSCWVIHNSPLYWGEIRGQFLQLAEKGGYLNYPKYKRLFPTKKYYQTTAFLKRMVAEFEKYNSGKKLGQSQLQIRYYDFSDEAWRMLEQIDYNRHPNKFERGFYLKFGLEKYLALYVLFGGRNRYVWKSELHKVPEIRQQILQLIERDGVLRAPDVSAVLDIDYKYASAIVTRYRKFKQNCF
jgi:hypothetical protein